MRTLPTAITTGLSTGLPTLWLVKIAGKVSTYYWPTASKNAAGNTLVLKATSGGSGLTYDSTMIAAEIDGESVAGIGEIDRSVDIRAGGAVASIGDVDIRILNQGRFDATILATAEQLEGREVSIYLGFVPDGATPTVVIADDMLLQWSGIVDDMNDFDFGEYLLSCVDHTFARHKPIPETLVDKTTYPNAPDESLGQPLPEVYGDFSHATSEQFAQDHMLLSLIPSVKVDTIAQNFVFANHQMHTQGNIYYFSSDLYAQIVSGGPTKVNTTIASCDWGGLGMEKVVGAFVVQPRIVKYGYGTPLNAQNAVDEDDSTGVTLTYAIPNQAVEYMVGRVPSEGDLTDSTGSTIANPVVDLIVLWGTMSASDPIAVLAFSEAFGTNGDMVEVATADASSRKEYNYTYAGLTVDVANSNLWIVKPSGVGDQFTFYNFAIRFYMVIAKLAFATVARK